MKEFFLFFFVLVLTSRVAAKQAAFEEQNKIKNQFRALDDDEADFLDEVRERKRRAEEAVKRETEEGCTHWSLLPAVGSGRLRQG